MATYHCRFKVHSRGTGAKAGQAAAYRSGTKVYGRTTNAVRSAAYRSGGELTDASGEVHDFSRKHGVVWNAILAPVDVPGWVHNRSELWRQVELKEDGSNRKATAQLFREAELSIPRELDPAQRIALVRQFVQEQFVAKGMVADIGIHCPRASDGGEQPHAHVMLTMRDIGPDGFGKKRRDWNDLTKAQKAAGLKSPLMQWREAWQRSCNDALREAGSAARVDHRSLAAQGRDYGPQPEQGAAIHAREVRGEYQARRDGLTQTQFDKRTRETARAAGSRPRAPASAGIMIALPTGTGFDQATRTLARAVKRVGRQPGFRLAEDGVAHTEDLARWLRGQDLEPPAPPVGPEVSSHDR